MSTRTPTDRSQPRAKRRRAARACERCRAKKYKCDESFPCRKCTKSQVECVYEGDFHLQRDNQAASYIYELEAKVEALNERLRQATAANQLSKTPSSTLWTTPHEPQNLYSESSPDPANNEHDTPSDALEEEISEVNQHTNTIEFHGNTSSAAALGHLQRAREPLQNPEKEAYSSSDQYNAKTTPQGSLISTLHNPNFSLTQLQVTQDKDSYAACAQGSNSDSSNKNNNGHYFEYAHVFMEGYFENLHFIHPLIDKENFILQAHNLWLGKSPQPDSSFIALYLSLLSLGALIRAWDEPRLGGLTRFEWSRKLFAEAQGYLNTWCFTNNLEIVQALYLMAKICQNELAPHLAYMYLGLAIRTCLAAGYNRETPGVKTNQHDWISRTWWGLYSLEIELSFSLGRPDTLGLDEYHNRCQPSRDGQTEYSVIPIMVDLAQIIRQVSIDIYHSRISIKQKMRYSLEIEQKLDTWLGGLPKLMQPDFGQSGGSIFTSIGALRDPKWSRRQRLVLGIRYHNVKMFIFRPFLAYLTLTPQEAGGNNRNAEAQRLLEIAAKKCLDSARKTVDVMYETFRQHTFFRCWWYNTTYIMFAVTNILLPLSRRSSSFLNLQETNLFTESIHKSIEILEAMDESVVATESVEIVKNYLKEYHRGSNHSGQKPDNIPDGAVAAPVTSLQQDATNDSIMADLGEIRFDDFLPELTLAMGSSDYPFESIAGLFGDITGPPVLE